MQNTKSSVLFAEPGGNAGVRLTRVPPKQGRTPEAAVIHIGRQQGIQSVEGAPLTNNGSPAYLGRYRVLSQADTVEVLAGFIHYEKNMHQLAGMAPSSVF